MTIAIRVNTRQAKAYFKQTGQALNAQNTSIRDALKVALLRYEAFTRRRFNVFSRGGGDWAPLAKSTIEARRGGGKSKGGVDFGGGRSLRGGKASKGARSSLARDTRKGGALVSAGGTVSILRDRGFLFNALTIGSTGNKVTDLRNGIAYGFSDRSHESFRFNALSKRISSGKRLTKKTLRIEGRSGANMSIARLATIHHYGSPSSGLPARPILVYPDKPTENAIRLQLTRGVKAALKGIR